METREAVIDRIVRKKIIAIVRGVYGQKCLDLAEALYDGGIELLEVTFDQNCPEESEKTVKAIREVSEMMGSRMIVGAGTVTSATLLDKAVDAGARFIISPNVDEAVIRKSRDMGLVSIPGALSPSEILDAYNYGADFVKIFPVVSMGAKYIKQVRGPLNHIRLMAVGGIDENNIVEYMDAGCCGAGIGGCLVNKNWINAGEFDKITALTRCFVNNLREGGYDV